MSPIRFRGGEFAFIDWIRSRPADTPGSLLVGPGDDACVLDVSATDRVAVTTDVLLEGTHFDRAKATAEEIGWKAIGVSLSDVAAMGMAPALVVAGVGVPNDTTREFLEGIYRGMRDLADRFDVPIAGGDVTSWDASRLVLCTTALGRDAGRKPILRSGAKPGDVILVTGELGGSLTGRHLRFVPRVEEALALVENFDVHAMIDLSDGLSSDLAHVARESKTGAVIDTACIPISDDARKASQADGRSPLDHALNDGEDFELLFTMSGAEADRLTAHPPFETRLSVIGRIVEGDDVRLRDEDGGERPIEPGGYEHLREG